MIVPLGEMHLHLVGCSILISRAVQFRWGYILVTYRRHTGNSLLIETFKGNKTVRKMNEIY